jgi:SnoaL-like protein
MGTVSDRIEIARRSYMAFAAGDRSFFEERLAGGFSFSSPPDPSLDRDGWFERCWPGAGRGQRFEFLRLLEAGDEVIVTYELRRPDGSGGRNTEILTFDDEDRIVRTEVYFGWDVASTA